MSTVFSIFCNSFLLCPLFHQISQPFPFCIPPHVLYCNVHHIFQRLRQMIAAGNVWCHKSIRNIPDSMIFRKWFWRCYIQCSSCQMPLFQCITQIFSTHHISTVFPLSHKSSVTSPPSLNTGKFRPIRFSGYSDSSFL